MRARLVSIFGMIGGMSLTTKALAWALGSSVAFQILATLMKVLGASLPPLEIAFVRGAAALVLVAVTWQALRDLRSLPDPKIHLLRAGLGTVALLCSAYALSTMLPLALFSLILYSRIFMMIPLAHVTLGERAGPALWAATLAGFAGVMLAVSPALTLPDQILGVAAMVVAAVTSAGSQLAVRRLQSQNARDQRLHRFHADEARIDPCGVAQIEGLGEEVHGGDDLALGQNLLQVAAQSVGDLGVHGRHPLIGQQNGEERHCGGHGETSSGSPGAHDRART
ncbi:DMT family transporter [Azospirillum doebereinerae]